MAGVGWSLAAFAAFVVAWAVMMAAMMFPAAAPMLLLFRTVARQRRASGNAFVPTWVFAAGYLLVWTAVGAVTWVLVQWLERCRWPGWTRPSERRGHRSRWARC